MLLEEVVVLPGHVVYPSEVGKVFITMPVLTVTSAQSSGRKHNYRSLTIFKTSAVDFTKLFLT